jgi:hypothetical protein
MHAPFLLLSGLIALAAWLLLYAMAVAATEPKDVEPGPASLALGGDESPALVNLLTGSWRVSHEALPATLLDLAARRFLEIQEVGPDRVICHVRERNSAGLLPHERRVLDHLQSLEVDGIVPAQALTTGPDHGKWWSAFRREVIADAKGRGLSRNRWSLEIWGFFGLLAVAPAALLAFWIEMNTTSTSDKDPRLGLFLLLWFGLMWLLGNTRDQRDTPRGREVASRWLGLREHLATNTVIPTLGPGAVAIWDRLLAYAAAMGMARAAVRAIPMGREDDRQAWTSHGGAWRRITVTYPRLRPFWGSSTWEALIPALIYIMISSFFLIISNDFRKTDPGSDAGRTMSLAGWIVGLVCLVVIAFWGRVAWFALSDLVTPAREVEGQVVRLRRFGSRDKAVFYCAVYAGRGHKVDAWKIGGSTYERLSQMSLVRVRLTPRLGCVRSIDVLEAAPRAASDREADVAAPMAVLDEAAAMLVRMKEDRDKGRI